MYGGAGVQRPVNCDLSTSTGTPLAQYATPVYHEFPVEQPQAPGQATLDVARATVHPFTAKYHYTVPLHHYTLSIKVGKNVHKVDLYVAPLKDLMLLGVDFLRGRKAKLDLEHCTLTMGERP